MTDGRKALGFAPSGFFVLRTPLLPFDELAALGEGLEAVGAFRDGSGLDRALAADRARIRQRLRAVVTRPEVRDAVFLASPSIDEGLESWEEEPDSERGRRLETALMSYVSRAAARATPFGLFAGCTTGAIGAATRLRLPSRRAYQRHSRLDMDCLWALAEAVERDPRLRAELTYRPNTSLYEAAGRLRLAEARSVDGRRSYHLVAFDKNPYLIDTLERAGEGASLGELAAALTDEEISRAEADDFVAELVDSQLLVSDVRPGVTGDEPVHALLATLGSHAATAPLAGRLEEARLALEEIDAEGPGVAPERYRSIAAGLGGLPVRPELSRLVQVDLVKPAREATLGEPVVTEISRGVRILHRLLPAPPADGLSRFREEFLQRYETREVPLVEALDEEAGIGFEVSDAPQAGASPLLAGLPFDGSTEAEGDRWTGRDGLVLGKLARALAEGAGEISIEAADLERLDPDRQPPLPDAFHVMAAVAAASEDAIARGAFRVLLDHVAGPSGAALLGRFCHADPGMLASVRAHLRAEESRRPDRVFAEIVHLPEGRVGNILCRPLLRDHEIAYLGRSGAPADRQIPVTDLLVSVQDDRIVLRSRRLGREVVPRLTTAHDYSWRSLGLYRFLCRLQGQEAARHLAWEWGPLGEAPFLPRVVSGRLVLSRARWNLAEPEVRMLGGSGTASGFAAVQEWRAERRLPRHVALVDDDNELVVDLDNVLSVEALARQLRGRRSAAVVEMFPGPDELCVSGPEGRFVQEVIVPFARTDAPEPSVDQPAGPLVSVRRRFPPGSEWLYVKVYSGAASADQLLTDLVAPVVESAVATGAADRWFFIRYADPDLHLRVRVHGEPERLAAEVLPRLQAVAAEAVDAGLAWRVQFDTYEREVERYGGNRGIELAERLFHADSDAVLAVLRSLSGDGGLDLRWRLALRGIDQLFDALGFDLPERRTVARAAREGYGREFGVDGTFQGAVGRRYRTDRPDLDLLLDPRPRLPARFTPGLQALRRRSLLLRPVAAELRELAERGDLSVPLSDVAGSYAHMHVNRLLRSAQRAQELVLYELLDRAYSARLGRLAASP